MPQHKSAKKRLRQSESRNAVNKSVKSNVSTQLKAIDKLIKDKKVDESMAKLKQVMSILHKSTQKKIMHLNKASRTISKLQKDISAISK
ncbi:30S ribosomal protein S20 [bacterium]|jgi:small subunit ribosomal protein S20|nr:30S ribosomal protein S20 [bacterium]|tara:strand:+ start:53 stop:319 length:267 start_codon:yes stop_codon:yes gene_type:complete